MLCTCTFNISKYKELVDTGIALCRPWLTLVGLNISLVKIQDNNAAQMKDHNKCSLVIITCLLDCLLTSSVNRLSIRLDSF